MCIKNSLLIWRFVIVNSNYYEGKDINQRSYTNNYSKLEKYVEAFSRSVVPAGSRVERLHGESLELYL
jgi:hypothetical protein